MIKKILRLTVLTLFIPTALFAEILFEDNFNAQADWSPTQVVYPGSTVCKPGDICGDLPGWSAFRLQGSPYNPVGNNTLILDSTNARGGTGKGMTYWYESGSTSTWWSDGQLSKMFAQSYDTMYIGYWVKFPIGTQFPPAGRLYQHKLVRIGHMAPEDYPNYPTQSPYNEPQVIFDITKRGSTPALGDLGVLPATRNHPDYYFDYSPYNTDVRYMVWGGNAYIPEGTGFYPSGLEDGDWHSLSLR